MKSLFAALLLVLSTAVHAQSSGPTVGDPIVLDLDLRPGERVELDSAGVDLVHQDAGSVTVRGFRPGTHALQFIATDDNGSTREIVGAIEISSVLHPDDELDPAPLAPPVPLAPNRTAWIAIGIAGLGSIAVWLSLLWAPRSRRRSPGISISAGEELMHAIDRVRRMPPSDVRFVTLSDAVRQFLARVDPGLGRELTSTELVQQMSEHVPERLIGDVRDVLSEGDYAKFSQWGGRSARFDSVLEEASHLAVLEQAGESG